MQKFNELRNKYNEFIYDSFNIEYLKNEMVITYHFTIPGLVEFNPVTKIPLDNINFKEKSKDFIEYLVFHTGLVELISYWKCACPKNVIIKAGHINEEQIKWFKKLYFNGLGELFYCNDIKTNIDDFMNITCLCEPKTYNVSYEGIGNLIPIGGGKDSCVTLELLKNEQNNSGFIINPKSVSINCAEISNIDTYYSINRKIDQELIRLNKEGFINGHTPFSSCVAFYAYLVAYLTNKKNIVLSNESSANESTVIGTNINHQYSKTYEFENDFNNYTKKYFKIDINYFSLLRPLSEYQIAMLFSKITKYHSIFKSCNLGSKNEEWDWCCNCPKCLFVFTILSPFLYKEQLINMFKEDLYNKEELLETFIEILGYSKTKPFECVGTYEEARYAASKVIKSLEDNKEELPKLLKYYKDNYELDTLENDLENEFNEQHNLNEYFVNIIKGALNND